jgi:hypothetical protein
MWKKSVGPRASLRVILGFAALVGSAVTANSQVINIPWAVTFKGSVELRGYPSDGTCLNVYTVPSGKKMRITDFALDAYGWTAPLSYQYICSGTPTCAVARSAYMTAPVGTTLTTNFSTGIALASGETLSVCNYSGTGRPTSWTFHGFLYTGGSY